MALFDLKAADGSVVVWVAATREEAEAEYAAAQQEVLAIRARLAASAPPAHEIKSREARAAEFARLELANGPAVENGDGTETDTEVFSQR